MRLILLMLFTLNISLASISRAPAVLKNSEVDLSKLMKEVSNKKSLGENFSEKKVLSDDQIQAELDEFELSDDEAKEIFEL